MSAGKGVKGLIMGKANKDKEKKKRPISRSSRTGLLQPHPTQLQQPGGIAGYPPPLSGGIVIPLPTAPTAGYPPPPSRSHHLPVWAVLAVALAIVVLLLFGVYYIVREMRRRRSEGPHTAKGLHEDWSDEARFGRVFEL